MNTSKYWVILVIITWWLVIGTAQARSDSSRTLFSPGLTVEAKGHFGFIWAHRQNMSHLVKDHVSGFELNFQRLTSGQLEWHKVFNKPYVGAGILHFDLGNKEELGTGTGFFGYIKFPIINRERFLFSYRWGTGIGYVSRPFDRETNYKNIAIGSSLNIFIHALLEAKVKVSKRLSLSAGLAFSHFSNAAYKVPNLGINVPTVSIGALYDIGVVSGDVQELDFPEYDKKLELSALGAFGFKEIGPIEGPKYSIGTASVKVSRQLDRKRKVGLGLDMFYDGSIKQIYNLDTVNAPSSSDGDFISYGVHLSHELAFGRFSAFTEMGIYLYSKYKDDGLLYHKFSYRYLVTDHVFFDVCLKTHWGRAQYMAWGLGYKF